MLNEKWTMPILLTAAAVLAALASCTNYSLDLTPSYCVEEKCPDLLHQLHGKPLIQSHCTMLAYVC